MHEAQVDNIYAQYAFVVNMWIDIQCTLNISKNWVAYGAKQIESAQICLPYDHLSLISTSIFKNLRLFCDKFYYMKIL